HRTLQLSRKVWRKHDAGRTTNRHRLVHQPEEESTHVRVVADNTERLARARRDPRGTREQNKFLPDFEKHVTRCHYIDASSLHLLHITLEHSIGATVETAAVDFGQCAGVADHTRPRDVRDHVGRSSNRGLISKKRGEPLNAVNAVLKGDDTGVGADQRAGLLTRRLGIPKLYG